MHAVDHPAAVALGGRARWPAWRRTSSTATPCELLTLHAATRLSGIGSALVAVVVDTARAAACRRLWVVTTNDNVDALRFYQRRGFRISSVRPGAVDTSRERLKPEIPLVGNFGIPLRDEIELELDLT